MASRLNSSTWDSDSDGVPKVREDQHWSRDDNSDTDGDGRDDVDEIYGTPPSDPWRPDSDYDGMPDQWELTNGLALTTADGHLDLDGDGLSNYDEYVHRTDADDADYDGDGFPDGIEVAAGTDPRDAGSKPELTFDNTLGPERVSDRAALLRAGLVSDGGQAPTVRIYWNTTDGGTNPATWVNYVELTDVAEGAFTERLTNLTYAETYYYRPWGSNPYVQAWADNTTSFVARYDFLIDNAGVSNLTAGSAELWGTLLRGTNVNPRFVFGETDGGTDTGNWDTVMYMNTNSAVSSVSTNRTGLTYGQRYYYRAHATNATGWGWAPETETFRYVYTNGFFLHVDLCGFDASDGPLTNFPVLLTLNDDIPGFRYSDFLSEEGHDLRIWLSSNRNVELNYEIERWNRLGDSLVWVQIPLLAGSDNSVVLTWGFSDQSDQPAYSQNGATWSEGFIGVWHMDIPHPPDASGHGNHGTGTLVSTAMGIVGGGVDFDGGDDSVIDITHAHGLPVYTNLTNEPFTFEGWVRGPDQQHHRYFGMGNDSDNDQHYSFLSRNTTANRGRVFIRDDAGDDLETSETGTTDFDDTWHHLVWIDDAGTLV
ncbi:MAG: hypothetical protein AAF492_08265, partial [Verrucomicrobiota bacterium]